MIFVFLFLALSLFWGELSSYFKLSKTLASAAHLLAQPHKKKKKKTRFFLPSWWFSSRLVLELDSRCYRVLTKLFYAAAGTILPTCSIVC